tara:strand:- start:5302 stop:6453 length:1152 start_codon:yes stop_codon:yes gene_type:complete
MKKIGILGSTGSIGTQALDIIKRSSNFRVEYLSAFSNINLLAQQTKEFKPKSICIVDESKFQDLQNSLLGVKVEILKGQKGLIQLSERNNIDLLLNALVGYLGMEPTLRSIEQGVDVALANKESLVVGGSIIKDKMIDTGANIFPVDSEHSAIWQCLEGENINEVNKLILTGSGGPFRTLNGSKFDNITKNEALKHPNWSMGSKITIDSATMMNKGLEVIEAYWLFDISINNIDILVHPQSIIHSMVEFIDGSIKAQLGEPSMTIPIHYALNYPNRKINNNSNFNFLNSPDLTFEKPDLNKFRCIKLAYDALKNGKSYPIVLNVANDLCVEAFLNDKIRFVDIASYIEDALETHSSCNVNDISSIFDVIKNTQNYIEQKIGNK